MKKAINYTLCIAISGVLLYFGLRQIQLTSVIETLKAGHYWFVLPAMVCYLGAFLMRTLRLRLLIWQKENHRFR